MSSITAKRSLLSRVSTSLLGVALLLLALRLGAFPLLKAGLCFSGAVFVVVGAVGSARFAFSKESWGRAADRLIFFLADAAESLDALVKPRG
ncbi:hypothetical protein [Pelagicoccus sp. SDUM812003]|uniref:hypothetical protein n=1 Tax=Pelagicoccus sp. SDUM812003 TaxID=3041267 RepID=UPI00280FA42E|nr:hypothetical protein [Pelagicoccus sp. SDUM812003]MDQ8203984.1 hypothetical protein [Pelagicoccus sp. SDUM812003]